MKEEKQNWHPLVEKYSWKLLNTHHKGCGSDQTTFYILEEFMDEVLLGVENCQHYRDAMSALLKKQEDLEAHLQFQQYRKSNN